MVMPKQKPGKSKQDYGTPVELLQAVEKRFGMIRVDLAASHKNAVASEFYTEKEDSLKQRWNVRTGNLWLNPPFANITPWAKKCSEYTGRGRILFLTPASVGSNWYRDHVDGKAYVIFLNGRLTFVGKTTPYPKDCMLSVFGQGICGTEVWDWRI